MGLVAAVVQVLVAAQEILHQQAHPKVITVVVRLFQQLTIMALVEVGRVAREETSLVKQAELVEMH